MNLVPGTVEETGVDEYHPVCCGPDAFLEVDRGAALLVHDAHLDRPAREAERFLDPAEQLVCEGHFGGAVHLRLDDVNRSGAAVAVAAGLLQVVQCDQHRRHGVQQPFEDGVSVLVQHRVVRHVMADVADQHQAAAGQRDRAAAGGGVYPVRIETPVHHPPALLEARGQVPLHQAKPVAVGEHLVFGIDGGDGVFAVHDRGHGEFEHEIRHPCCVVLADEMAVVDQDFDVEAVMSQQHGRRRRGIAAVADELRGTL